MENTISENEKLIIEEALSLRKKLWNIMTAKNCVSDPKIFYKQLFACENKCCKTMMDREMFRTVFLFASEENASIFRIYMDVIVALVPKEFGVLEETFDNEKQVVSA